MATLKEQLKCGICLNIYTSPVTLRCGHSFCQACIDVFLDTHKKSVGYSCPECRERFQKWPPLQKNITLCNIVEDFLSTKPTRPSQESPEVFCTFCSDSPVPARKSCQHLGAHEKAPEHIFHDSTASSENRKCSVHNDKILEYFCTEDSTCVCVTCCLKGNHRCHEVETVDEACEKRIDKLKNIRREIMKKKQETEERVQNLEERKGLVQEKADDERHRVAALFVDLRKWLENLESRVMCDITKEAESVCLSYDDVIRQLEIKIEELSGKMRHIEKLCNMTDPLTVLQESHTGDLYVTEDRHDHQLHDEGDLDVAVISNSLHTGLSDIVSGLTGGIYIQPTDIQLDANTSSGSLDLSDDRKTISRTLIMLDQSESPTRFCFPFAVSTRSFTSGRHYFEVDVGSSHKWQVGVCFPNIARRGMESLIGNNDLSWGVVRNGNHCTVTHDKAEIQFPFTCRNKVRVYLDYESGQISFYSVHCTIRHLHTFTATLTEPLHAIIGVWDGFVRICEGNH
ncbi:E3 ubiquitin-protein ligase TRIM39-like [Hyperolius riggenbachi]|uniref:E3 ubiquitin-protein ligase TRIM39-like n=1 Tax=Hyperolius riggenbachi TaxID=752182 RepID=UPI0035A3C842